jgi:excisionase family DNA binding protein
MQLVDAIRQAAKHSMPTSDPTLAGEPPPSSAVAGSTAVHVAAPAEPSRDVFGGSVVRIELFLSPDQLNNLLRGIIGAQHSVLTLREAAKYVRITATDLENLCETHQVPAFKLEGKWRFPKAALDEWLAAQSLEMVGPDAEGYQEDLDGD